MLYGPLWRRASPWWYRWAPLWLSLLLVARTQDFLPVVYHSYHHHFSLEVASDWGGQFTICWYQQCLWPKLPWGASYVAHVYPWSHILRPAGSVRIFSLLCIPVIFASRYLWFIAGVGFGFSVSRLQLIGRGSFDSTLIGWPVFWLIDCKLCFLSPLVIVSSECLFAVQWDQLPSSVCSAYRALTSPPDQLCSR